MSSTDHPHRPAWLSIAEQQVDGRKPVVGVPGERSCRPGRSPATARDTAGAGAHGRQPVGAVDDGAHEVQPSSPSHPWQAELVDLCAHPSGSPRRCYARVIGDPGGSQVGCRDLA
jgi:hypothetical protein